MRILMATALAAATTLAGASVTTMAAAQSGSYAASCRNVANLGNGAISAECADTSGRFRSTTIQSNQCQGDIGNQNGTLACNGAMGAGGPYIPQSYSSSGRSRDYQGYSSPSYYQQYYQPQYTRSYYQAPYYQPYYPGPVYQSYDDSAYGYLPYGYAPYDNGYEPSGGSEIEFNF